MGMRSYDNVQITGLSASGTADGTGSWNTNVNIGSFVSVPAGATGVWLRIDITTGGWLGLRTPGKTTAETHADHITQQGSIRCIPLGANNTIDIYVQSTTTIKIYIIGVTDARWTFANIDGPRDTISLTSGYANFTLSNAPDGSIAAIIAPNTLLSWRPYGSSAAYIAGIGRAVVQLDGSKRVSLRSSAADTGTIIGYISGGCNFNATQFDTSETFTADSTWRSPSTLGASGKQAVQLLKGTTGEDSFGASFRKAGSTYNPNSTLGTYIEYQMVPLNGSGAFEYWVETGATNTLWYQLVTFDDFQSSSLSITSVTPSSFDDGRTGIVIAGTGFGASQGSSTLKLGAQAQTVTAWSDTSITFTCVRDSGGSMGARTLTLVKV